MRLRFTAGLLVTAAFAGLAAAGDDAKKYDIDWHDRWEAKQILTVAFKESIDSETTLAGKSMNKRHQALDAVYVVRCEKAGAGGEAATQTVFVRSWKAVDDAATDESLEGAVVMLRDGEWKLRQEMPLSELATIWIDDTFGTTRVDDPLESLAPKQLTVGQPWKPAPKAVAEAYAKGMGGVSVDVAAATMELVLESAEGTPPNATGQCSFKAHVPILGAPNLPSNAVILPGSGANFSGTRTGPLTKATMLRHLHVEKDVTVHVERTVQQGVQKFTNKTKGSQDWSAVAGGEIPAPAKPPEGK